MMSRGAGAFVGAAVMTAVSAGGAHAGTCTLPGWGIGPNYVTDIRGAAVTSADGFIYSAGGYTIFTVPGFPGPVPFFQRYDPGSGAWTSLAFLPSSVNDASLVYDSPGGRLFPFGGMNFA